MIDVYDVFLRWVKENLKKFKTNFKMIAVWNSK